VGDILKVNGEPKVAAKIEAKRKAWLELAPTFRTEHLVYHADARNLKDYIGMRKDIGLVLTSPPYWNLKRYGEEAEGQLGRIPSDTVFHRELNKVWKSCLDVIIPGGRMCVVVGDVLHARRKHGKHSVTPLHADIIRNCREIGFDYLSPIIWYKIGNMATEAGGSGAFLGKPYEPNAIVKNDIEYILMFRKPGRYRSPKSPQRELSVIDKEDFRKWFRQVWDDIPGTNGHGHPAPFPEELAYRLISMFSFVGDAVLDPFLGSATTTAAAMRAHRSSIGFEVERAYFELAKQRLGQRSITSMEVKLGFVEGQHGRAEKVR
jgi:DNA modification methylase